MKKIVILIIIILMAAGCNKGKNNISSQNTENKNIEVGIEEGNIAPDIELFTLSGEKKYLKDFAGKIVMLNFWATWCPPCRSEMPSIENFYKKNGDVEVVAVSVDEDSPSQVESFIKENGYTFPIYYDTNQTLSKKFFIRSIPTTYIIDKNGQIYKKISGAFNWEEIDLSEIQK